MNNNFYGKWDMRVDTPFGDDDFILTINSDNSCILDSLLDSYQIDNDLISIEDSLISLKFDINTPISAVIQIQMLVDNGTNLLASGWLSIGDYIRTRFSASKTAA